MMLWLAAALAVAAVVVAVRWVPRRRDALGRARRFPFFSVGALLVLAVLASVPTYLRQSEERKLSAVAGTLVGTPVKVHCQTFGQEFTQLTPDLGFVRWGGNGVPEHQTYLVHSVCADLRSYLHSDKANPSPAQVIAVHVLTHESMHMRGITSESQAECAAMQRDAVTAQLLGATPAEALALAQRYWRVDYPRMSSTYQSPDCVPGGSLDEHLPDPPWTPAG
jgi:hypothetical protein